MASRASTTKRKAGSNGARGKQDHALPAKTRCREILAKMMLIRRFEERAGEMYAKAKIGGFLHLCIGEEAAIVGATNALEETDYLMSTYREHGQAIARGTPPEAVMAELFGKKDGCSGGRGGSMHLFDYERRFLGGYGIVGGNLPLAAGVALAADYRGENDVMLCMFGDGATNQGTFGETMNLAALWKLPVVFMVINNQFGMGTSLERHSAVTDLSKKAEGFGVPGSQCDGMDVLDTRGRHRRGRALRARGAQAAARRGRDVPLPRPLDGRPRGVPHEGGGRGVAQARPDRDLRQAARGRGRARREGPREARRGGDRARSTRRSSSPTRARSPTSTRSTTTSTSTASRSRAGTRSTSARRTCIPGEEERDAPEISHELAKAGAAYAGTGEQRPTRTTEDEEEDEE